MTDRTYPACIRELYESEIFGEAVFAALVGSARNEREAYHIGSLLQLETETKARLRPFLMKHGISLDETMELPPMSDFVTGYLSLSWADFMKANVPVIQNFLTSFDEIVRIGPKEDFDVLQSMVAHESAILKWASLESEGENDHSLDDVVAQLEWPLKP